MRFFLGRAIETEIYALIVENFYIVELSRICKDNKRRTTIAMTQIRDHEFQVSCNMNNP